MRVVSEHRNVRSGQICDSGPGERFGSSGIEWSVTWHQEVELRKALRRTNASQSSSTYTRERYEIQSKLAQVTAGDLSAIRLRERATDLTHSIVRGIEDWC